MNKKIWDQLKRPPKEALKTIRGGRLAGMTDINPQWRYEIMTEAFGPVGEGWKFEITRTWTEQGHGGVVMAFAMVRVYYRHEGSWSDPIEGVGGSTLIQQERGGLYNNDEAWKMAVTDALSTALKLLGVGADIYAGKWDGSKYSDDDKGTAKGGGGAPSRPNLIKLVEFNRSFGKEKLSEAELLTAINAHLGTRLKHWKALDEDQADKMLKWLKALSHVGKAKEKQDKEKQFIANAKKAFEAEEVAPGVKVNTTMEDKVV